MKQRKQKFSCHIVFLHPHSDQTPIWWLHKITLKTLSSLSTLFLFSFFLLLITNSRENPHISPICQTSEQHSQEQRVLKLIKATLIAPANLSFLCGSFSEDSESLQLGRWKKISTDHWWKNRNNLRKLSTLDSIFEVNLKKLNFCCVFYLLNYRDFAAALQPDMAAHVVDL